ISGFNGIMARSFLTSDANEFTLLAVSCPFIATENPPGNCRTPKRARWLVHSISLSSLLDLATPFHPPRKKERECQATHASHRRAAVITHLRTQRGRNSSTPLIPRRTSQTTRGYAGSNPGINNQLARDAEVRQSPKQVESLLERDTGIHFSHDQHRAGQ